MASRRRLRQAIAEGGLPDRVLAGRCAAEDRILLTKDRDLAAVAGDVVRIVLLAPGGIDKDALSLRNTLGIDWQHAPFTRCLVDNRLLGPAPVECAAWVPANSRAAGGPLRVCHDCGRLYWLGGHVLRMQQRLRGWHDAPPSRA